MSEDPAAKLKELADKKPSEEEMESTIRFLKAGRLQFWKTPEGKYGATVESPNDPSSGGHDDYFLEPVDTFPAIINIVCNMVEENWPDTEFMITHLLHETPMNYIEIDKLRAAAAEM